MTDLRALTDAFTELERRADASGAVFELPAPRRAGPRLVPIAAGLAVAAGLVAGAVVLTRDPGTQTAAPPVTTTASATQPPETSVRDMTPEQLIDRFRTVLGDTATFEVTDSGAAMETQVADIVPSGEGPPPGDPKSSIEAPTEPETNGAAIVGTLTAAGVTGGFDLMMYQDSPDGTAFCFEIVEGCEQRTLPDGTQIAFWTMSLNGAPGSVTYTVNVIHPDGVRLEIHLSNQRSPKGESEKLAEQPPFTMDQLVAVATSDRW